MTAPVDPREVQADDPAAVQASDVEIETLRAGQLPANADALARELATWVADIWRGTAV